MATRSILQVTRGESVLVYYHHFDGYPEKVGRMLLEMIRNDPELQGDDLLNHDFEYLGDGDDHPMARDNLQIEWRYDLMLDGPGSFSTLKTAYPQPGWKRVSTYRLDRLPTVDQYLRKNRGLRY